MPNQPSQAEPIPPIVPQVEPTEPTVDKEQLEQLEKLCREYRALVLEAAASGKCFDKKAALELMGENKNLTLAVHKDFLTVKKLMSGDEPISWETLVTQVKAHLNTTYKRANLKKWATKLEVDAA